MKDSLLPVYRCIQPIDNRQSAIVNPNDYWSQARHPLVCLVFFAPLLVIYEAGVMWFGGHDPEAIRNGADYWMRAWLGQVGLPFSWLLPAMVVVILLCWQAWGRYPWRVSSETLVGMFAESLLFAFFLIVVGQLQDLVFQQLDGPADLSIGGEPFAGQIVSFIGAGVYEEVMFRLCLLPAAYGLLRLLTIEAVWAATLAVLFTSFVFATAHYVGPAAEQFTLFSFTFRALAGLFFAGLFVVRGFGITVGCHAVYDLLVGVLLTIDN